MTKKTLIFKVAHVLNTCSRGQAEIDSRDQAVHNRCTTSKYAMGTNQRSKAEHTWKCLRYMEVHPYISNSL